MTALMSALALPQSLHGYLHIFLNGGVCKVLADRPRWGCRAHALGSSTLSRSSAVRTVHRKCMAALPLSPGNRFTFTTLQKRNVRAMHKPLRLSPGRP